MLFDIYDTHADGLVSVDDIVTTQVRLVHASVDAKALRASVEARVQPLLQPGDSAQLARGLSRDAFAQVSEHSLTNVYPSVSRTNRSSCVCWQLMPDDEVLSALTITF